MIIVTKPGITNAEIDHIRERIESLGLRTHISRGEHRTIVGCIGDEDRLREVPILAIPGVEQVLPVLKPYKLAAREFAASPTVVRVGGASFGGTESLIEHRASVEGPETRTPENLLRLSVGLEHPDDVIADLARALD